MVFIHRKKTNYLSRFAVLTYSLFTLFAAVVQYLYPNLLVLNSSVTVSIFIIYLSLQNPSLTKDALEEAEKSRKAAEEANAAKSVFLANISHEIRTPMNAIFGMTYLLEDRELRSDAREYINTIRTASENLLSLINDILDFSKSDSGKMTLDSVEYRLEDVIRDAEVLEKSRWRLSCIRKALLATPVEYRQGTLDSISYNVPYSDFAHENTWRKWKQVLIWELAKNLFLI